MIEDIFIVQKGAESVIFVVLEIERRVVFLYAGVEGQRPRRFPSRHSCTSGSSLSEPITLNFNGPAKRG